jgi:two-component system, OmpR family, KDP operon response regulator KdpE
MKARILLIEDEPSIRRFLVPVLEEQGFEVREAASGVEGVREAVAFRPNLVLLDLGLPDRPGESVLKSLREWSKIPIVILTAKGEEAKKVELLDAGADDYITKPFSIAELSARIRVSLRHSEETKEGPVFRAGEIEVDLSGRVVRRKGETVHLTSTEYDVLRMLIRNAGKIVTQRQMLVGIWGPNAVEFTHYLRVYVGQLRKKLEEDPANPRLILTEPGVGYRLAVDIANGG